MFVGDVSQTRLPNHRRLLPGCVECRRPEGLLLSARTGGVPGHRDNRDVCRHLARLLLPFFKRRSLLVCPLHLQSWSAWAAVRSVQWSAHGNAGLVLQRCTHDHITVSFDDPQPRQRLRHRQHGVPLLGMQPNHRCVYGWRMEMDLLDHVSGLRVTEHTHCNTLGKSPHCRSDCRRFGLFRR